MCHESQQAVLGPLENPYIEWPAPLDNIVNTEASSCYHTSGLRGFIHCIQLNACSIWAFLSSVQYSSRKSTSPAVKTVTLRALGWSVDKLIRSTTSMWLCGIIAALAIGPCHCYNSRYRGVVWCPKLFMSYIHWGHIFIIQQFGSVCLIVSCSKTLQYASKVKCLISQIGMQPTFHVLEYFIFIIIVQDYLMVVTQFQFQSSSKHFCGLQYCQYLSIKILLRIIKPRPDQTYESLMCNKCNTCVTNV